MTDGLSSAAPIERLLRPRSVAVIGASDKPGALGGAVLANLDRFGFAGKVFPVNPRLAAIGGRPCLPDTSALPPGVDVAVLAIPGAAVLEAMRALAARQVGAAVIFAAGFAEGGAEGAADQHAIAHVARQAGMIVEGPNCLGLVNFVDGIPLTFVEAPAVRLGDRPGLAIVSQSGAMAAVLGTVLAARQVPLSYSISTGNEAATGVEDFVDHLIDDPDTNVLAMIVEQFRTPRRFLAAARRAQAAGKTIVLLHPGRSQAARESAATHTGAMAGDHRTMSVLVEHAGVIRVDTLEELGDVAEIALRCPPVSSGGVAVLGESGAFKAQVLDLAEAVCLPLPALDDAAAPALRAALPGFVPVTNPLDVTAQGLVDPDLYRRTMEALLADDRFGSVLAGIIQTDEATCRIKFPPLIAALEQDSGRKAVLVAGLDDGAPVPAEFVERLRALGVPYLPSPERAVRALAHLHRHAATPPSSPSPEPRSFGLPALAELHGVVPEHTSKVLLAGLGFPFPQGMLAGCLEEARSAAGAIGYPVVIKAQSAALAHKSDAGGVIAGIADAAALDAAWHRLHADVAHHRPGLSLDGVLVERMGARGVEMIVGARNDPDWGPVLLVGFGGVQAEILGDVRLMPAGLSAPEIEREALRLNGAALLRGFRGSPPLDTAALAALVARLGQLMLAEPRLREVDLNPVLIYPVGGGALALDALLLVGD